MVLEWHPTKVSIPHYITFYVFHWINSQVIRMYKLYNNSLQNLHKMLIVSMQHKLEVLLYSEYKHIILC